jgi:hypothetical protein
MAVCIPVAELRDVWLSARSSVKAAAIRFSASSVNPDRLSPMTLKVNEQGKRWVASISSKLGSWAVMSWVSLS